MPAFMYSAVWIIWKARYLILAPQARFFFLKWSKIFNFITMKTDQERKKPKKAKKPFGMQIFRKKATGLQKKPKTGFLAWKKATWQPWRALVSTYARFCFPARESPLGQNPDLPISSRQTQKVSLPPLCEVARSLAVLSAPLLKCEEFLRSVRA